jgi:hypothetical protein
MVSVAMILRQLLSHLWCISYSHNEIMVHISFIVVLYCLKHDTIAMHLFQSKLCSYQYGELKDLMKIYCFSDGAA